MQQVINIMEHMVHVITLSGSLLSMLPPEINKNLPNKEGKNNLIVHYAVPVSMHQGNFLYIVRAQKKNIFYLVYTQKSHSRGLVQIWDCLLTSHVFLIKLTLNFPNVAYSLFIGRN